MVERRRLIKPADDFSAAFPGLNFRNQRSLVTAGENVLLVDPIYIADVYNSTDELASFLREQGLFLKDFGGDTAVPVWWKPPFLVMPTSMHLEDRTPPAGAKVLTEEIGCDSGSFVFLPLSAKISPSVRSKVKELLGENTAVALRLPAGRWTAYYEQFDAPQANMVGLYRNIVLKHTSLRERPGEAKGHKTRLTPISPPLVKSADLLRPVVESGRRATVSDNRRITAFPFSAVFVSSAGSTPMWGGPNTY